MYNQRYGQGYSGGGGAYGGGSSYTGRYTGNTGYSSNVNRTSYQTCHYCNQKFQYTYDLNNHFVVCPKRQGKYGAQARGMSNTQNYASSNSYGMGQDDT